VSSLRASLAVRDPVEFKRVTHALIDAGFGHYLSHRHFGLDLSWSEKAVLALAKSDISALGKVFEHLGAIYHEFFYFVSTYAQFYKAGTLTTTVSAPAKLHKASLVHASPLITWYSGFLGKKKVMCACINTFDARHYQIQYETLCDVIHVVSPTLKQGSVLEDLLFLFGEHLHRLSRIAKKGHVLYVPLTRGRSVQSIFFTSLEKGVYVPLADIFEHADAFSLLDGFSLPNDVQERVQKICLFVQKKEYLALEHYLETSLHSELHRAKNPYRVLLHACNFTLLERLILSDCMKLYDARVHPRHALTQDSHMSMMLAQSAFHSQAISYSILLAGFFISGSLLLTQLSSDIALICAFPFYAMSAVVSVVLFKLLYAKHLR
jgi:hypothetical protein